MLSVFFWGLSRRNVLGVVASNWRSSISLPPSSWGMLFCKITEVTKWSHLSRWEWISAMHSKSRAKNMMQLPRSAVYSQWNKVSPFVLLYLPACLWDFSRNFPCGLCIANWLDVGSVRDSCSKDTRADSSLDWQSRALGLADHKLGCVDMSRWNLP